MTTVLTADTFKFRLPVSYDPAYFSGKPEKGSMKRPVLKGVAIVAAAAVIYAIAQSHALPFMTYALSLTAGIVLYFGVNSVVKAWFKLAGDAKSEAFDRTYSFVHDVLLPLLAEEPQFKDWKQWNPIKNKNLSNIRFYRPISGSENRMGYEIKIEEFDVTVVATELQPNEFNAFFN